MIIDTKQVTQLIIKDVPRLDPITVTLEDLAPRKGKITVECYGKAWSAFWGGMGDQTIAQFFQSVSSDYIAGNFDSSIRGMMVDSDSIKEGCFKQVVKDRKERDLSKEEARELFDEIEWAHVGDDGWADPKLMEKIFGEEWWHRLPEKPNPEYQYLCRIIDAVQAALKSLVPEEVPT